MIYSTQFMVTAVALPTVASAVPYSQPKIKQSREAESLVRPPSVDFTPARLDKPLYNDQPTGIEQKLMSGSPLRDDSSTHVRRSSVIQIWNPNFDSTADGPVAHLKALRTHNAVVPKSLRDAVAKRSTSGSVASPVQIDTPAQTVYLDFDTESSDLWLFSTETKAGEVNGQTQFDSSRSSTARNMTGSTFAVSYSDASDASDASKVSGNAITDKVNVGGLTVSSMAVELASQVSASLTAITTADGMLGLAFNRLNGVSPNKQNTLVSSASSMATDVFTANLKKGAPDTFDFGHIDSSKYNGDITYTPVNKEDGYWGFAASGSAIGNEPFGRAPIYAIVDTGTSLILPQ